MIDRLRAVRKRVRALLHPHAAQRELEREIALHLELEEREYLRRGLSPAEARRRARLAFGGVERYAEQTRDVRGLGWLDDLWRDMRHALRSFARNPGFTSAAVLTLALGAGATVAVFSVVHAVLLAPLAYEQPERLLRMWETNPAQGIEYGQVSPGTFSDLRERTRTLEAVALYLPREFLLEVADRGEEVWGAAVSPAMFDLLGVAPIAGRTFGPESVEGPTDAEVVIGYGLAQRWFGSAAAAVGRTIRDPDYEEPLEVIGVMPPGFDFPDGAGIWFPVFQTVSVSATQRQFRYYEGLVRLRPGAMLEQARAEAAAISAALEVEHPASNAGWRIRLDPLEDSIVGSTRPALLVLLGLVGCLLLIACANVANLMVARALARDHEVAVRLALGAGGGRLVRQWLTESLLIALAGGAVGLALAWGGTRVLVALAPGGIPRLDEVALGTPVLFFALAITTAVAALTGLAPALHAAAGNAHDALRSGTRRTTSGSRAREWLVGAQIALTLVLLTSATLLLRSFLHLRDVDLGFRHANGVAVDFRVPVTNFMTPERRPWYARAQFYEGLIAELRRVHGVTGVAGVTDLPLANDAIEGTLWRTDAPGAHGRQPPTSATDQWKAAISIVTPDYFMTMGIPIERGRGFLPTDRFTADQLGAFDGPRPPGVAIISQTFAERFFPREEPVGRRIFLFDDQAFAAYRTIVGIAGDVRTRAVAEPPGPTVYLPFGQHSGRALVLVVRSDLPLDRLRPAIEAQLESHPEILVPSFRTLDAVVEHAVSRPRFNLVLAAAFAALALALAGIGVAGVVGYLVARRTRELGVRMALGARAPEIARLVLTDGLRPVAAGILAGAAGSLAAARAIRSLLFGIEPLDAPSFLAAVALLVIAAALAALVPAARATRLDPVAALNGSAET
ncbi:MAG TPA: ABC transporter permease [Longimicrobiales bacterium]